MTFELTEEAREPARDGAKTLNDLEAFYAVHAGDYLTDEMLQEACERERALRTSIEQICVAHPERSPEAIAEAVVDFGREMGDVELYAALAAAVQRVALGYRVGRHL